MVMENNTKGIRYGDIGHIGWAGTFHKPGVVRLCSGLDGSYGCVFGYGVFHNVFIDEG